MRKQAAIDENMITRRSYSDKLAFFWNFYAACHDSLYMLMPYRKLLWDCLQALDLEPGMRILNLGCGTGAFERFLAEKGIDSINIEALESSPSRLKIAEKKYTGKNANYRLSSNIGEKLPFADAFFDAAVSINVIPFLEKPNFMLEELRRVVKPDGNIVITKPKIKFKKMPILLDHIERFKNIKGTVKKVDMLNESLKAASVLMFTPIINPLISRTYKKVNKLVEKDLVDFSNKYDYQGCTFSPIQASQGVLVSIRNFAREEIAYPVHFKKVTGQLQLEQSRLLRFKIYCQEREYLEPKVDSLGLEGDKYDPISTHFIATNNNGVGMGTIRLIAKSKLGLPIQNHFSIRLLPRAAEVSRLMVCMNGRTYGHKIALGLYKLCYDYSLDNNIKNWYFILDDRLRKLYEKKLNFVLHRLGEPKYCFGDITAPYLLNLQETMDNLHEQKPQLYNYLCEPFSGRFDK